jgi:hypothetical protein
MGYGDWDSDRPSTGMRILGWDAGDADWFDASAFGSCATVYREVDDELWAVALQPNDTPDVARITSGHSVTLMDTSVPYVHMFDCVYFDSKLFICGARYISSVDDSCTWYSTDDGSTWNEAHVVTAGSRMYSLFVLGSELYDLPNNGSTFYKTGTGTPSFSSTGHSTGGPSFVRKPRNVSGGVLYRGSGEPGAVGGASVLPETLYRYTGSANASSIISSDVFDHCVAPDGTPYVLRNVSSTRKVYVGNASGTSFSDTGITSVPSAALSIAVDADAIYIGTTDSHLHRYWLNQDFVTDSTGHQVVLDASGNRVTYQ